MDPPLRGTFFACFAVDLRAQRRDVAPRAERKNLHTHIYFRPHPFPLPEDRNWEREKSKDLAHTNFSCHRFSIRRIGEGQTG